MPAGKHRRSPSSSHGFSSSDTNAIFLHSLRDYTGGEGVSLTVSSTGIQLGLLNNNSRAAGITNQAAERLATGLRINHASDDPAGLIAAEGLRGDIVEINANFKSAEAEQSQLSVQQSGRQIASDVLRDIGGLLVESGDGFTSESQLAAIQGQIDSSLDSLGYLSTVTGITLPASLEELRDGGDASASAGAAADGAVLVEQKLSSLNLASAAAGAYEKYTLEVDKRIAEDQAVAAASSLSQIADADYASEASNLVRGHILEASTVKMLTLYRDLQKERLGALFDII
jgi:flagellin